jgi:hypothetical protein|tara:strand:- start:80 stop:457 length:378 start_codon:yes stop_codon:yes gene_type:complete
MEIQGKLIEKYETIKINDSFRKREFVVEYIENPQYPELLKFDLIQDKCDLLEEFNIRDTLKVEFNLKGRKWTDPSGNDKYFNTLQAWRLSLVDSEIVPRGSTQTNSKPSEETTQDSFTEDDDLPF